MKMVMNNLRENEHALYVRTGLEESVCQPKVSAVIITYNEEKNIARTLAKLAWCDEIVVVDSGSTDATTAICREHGCIVHTRTFDGYGSQKRFAVEKASHEWILNIDADEVLSDRLIAEIQEALTTRPEYDGFAIPLNMVFLNKEFRHGKESGRHYLRLYNKLKGGFTEDAVHESIQVQGPILKLRNIGMHYSYSSLYQYMEKCNRYSSYSAGIAFSKGKNKSMLAVLFALPFNFFKYYLLERNFLNGTKGFYWSVLSSYCHFLKYVKLKELNKEALQNRS